MLRTIILFGGLLVGLYGCNSDSFRTQIKEIQLNKPKVESYMAREISKRDRIELSLNSLLQANNKGIALTPRLPISGTSLFYIPDRDINKKRDVCCNELRSLIRQGRGPGELQFVYASSETYNSDTLLFYSAKDARFVLFNQSMKQIKARPGFNLHFPVDFRFTLSNGYLLVPLDPQFFPGGKLLRIINTNTGKAINTYDARVPLGYEPHIRNNPSCIVSLPDGFGVAFIGDRSVELLDYQGNVKTRLIFGKSDPIGKPYKIRDPSLAPAGNLYIHKMEFQDGYLYVMVDHIIWIIRYKNLKPVTRLKIFTDIDQEATQANDFSIVSDRLFIRKGWGKLYVLPFSENWLKEN